MAIDELLDEHEQGERVRTWLRENALGLIGGIAIGLAAIFGWNKWQQHQLAAKQRPGANYQVVIDQLDAEQIEQAQAGINQLQGHGYGALAALEMSRMQLEKGERDAAIATLAAVTDADAALQPVIARRHARLLADAERFDEALAALGDAQDAETLEIRGDIELAAGRTDAARDAYLKAWPQLEVGSPQRNVLELKLSEVGGVPAQNEGNSQ